MMNKFKKSDAGYTSIEATLSLSFFILAIMFIYSQAKVVIGENIMQNAVNNMAKETSSYVYILDRLDMILKHEGDENKDINAIIGDGKDMGDAVQECVDMLGNILGGETDLESAGEGVKETVGKVKSSGSDMVKDIQTFISDDNIGSNLKNVSITAGESLVKKLSNVMLSGFYKSRLEKYLPMEYDKFCEYFEIDKDSISFDSSMVFPTEENDTMIVAVTYKTESPVKFIPLQRKICKYAYTAAWVSSNKNEIKPTKETD